MGNFCTKCGKPLAEGEVCDCVNQTQSTQNMNGVPNQAQASQNMNGMPNQTMNEAAEKASNYMKDVLEVAKKLAKNPISEGKAFAQKGDLKQSAFFLAIQALLSAIFALVICFKVSSLFSSLNSLYSSFSLSSSKKAVSMPYASAFFGTLVLSLVLSFLLAGILWCANKIIKHNVSYQQMVGCVALRSLVQAVVTVVCIVLCLINIYLGVGLFLIVGISTFAIFGFNVPENNQVVSQNIFYAILVSIIVFIIVMVFIMSKTSGMYVPSTGVSSLASMFF